MAILRSLEGTFYDVPDGELDKFQVPPDQVKGLMESAGQKPPQGPRPQQQQQQQTFQVSGDASRGAPQILVQFITQAAPSQQQQPPPQQQQQAQKPAGQGQEEQVEPQWYWVNWFNWANWYNWY